jgi:SAM-dependent methyltransferase
VILLCDIIEHIEEPQAFLKSALHHLKPGGVLFVNVPALSFLYSRFDETVGHLRRYTKSSLKKECAMFGSANTVVQYWGLSLVPIALLRKFVVSFLQSSRSIVTVGFRPPERARRVLQWLMLLETKLLKRPFIGTSVFLAAQRGV